jgi:hypothetical protein
MTDSLPDDARMRATEAQMRRALGLNSDGPSQTTSIPTAPPSPGVHSQRRRFVRDGEVVVQHREHSTAGETGTNQLATARQALREQIAAREEVERSLAEAQNLVRDLQTKLAHERLAKDEAVNRAEVARQAAEQALQVARDELDSERGLRQEAEQRLTEALDRVEHKLPRSSAPVSAEEPAMPRSAPVSAEEPAMPRRRGRPPKVRQIASEQEGQAEFVEWWVPGWQERFR